MSTVRQYRLSNKLEKKLLQIVGREPAYAEFLPLFIYQDKIHKLEFLAFILNNTPNDDPAYTVVEMLEELLTQPLSKKDWVKGVKKTLLGETPYYPAPGSPLYLFNEFAKWSHFSTGVVGHEGADGDIEVSVTREPFPAGASLAKDNQEVREELMDSKPFAAISMILWSLWECHFEKIDLGLLKKCSVCEKWFVDRSQNKMKARCSMSCTHRYWSWTRRKEANHDLSSQKRKKRTKAKASRKEKSKRSS